MGHSYLLRKRIEICVAVILVAIYFSGPFLFLPSVCSTAEQHPKWGNKFLCEANASDFAVGLFTLFLFIATYFLWRETERLARGADDQADKMERSIAEAAKAATAMSNVATAMTVNVERLKDSLAIQREIADRQKLASEMQLRAYISVIIGGGIYQEREKDLKFEGRPLLLNQGATPAEKVTHQTYAGIFPVPLPKGFEFPQQDVEVTGENMIGPQQNRTLSGIVPDYVDERDVPDIKRGNGRGLYVWGYVAYEDAFGEKRETRFCQLITWLGDGKVWGYFIPNRNSAT